MRQLLIRGLPNSVDTSIINNYFRWTFFVSCYTVKHIQILSVNANSSNSDADVPPYPSGGALLCPAAWVYMGGREGFEGRQAKFVPFHAQILRRSASTNLPTRSALWAVDRARRSRRESLMPWRSTYAKALCYSDINACVPPLQ